MSVRVGSVVGFQGVKCVCTRIRFTEETIFAPEASEVMQANVREPVNVKHLDLKFEEFLANDIVTISSEVAELTAPGQNVFMIYKKYHVVKAREEQLEGEKECSQQVVASDKP